MNKCSSLVQASRSQCLVYNGTALLLLRVVLDTLLLLVTRTTATESVILSSTGRGCLLGSQAPTGLCARVLVTKAAAAAGLVARGSLRAVLSQASHARP